jgi:hypothetical protein
VAGLVWRQLQVVATALAIWYSSTLNHDQRRRRWRRAQREARRLNRASRRRYAFAAGALAMSPGAGTDQRITTLDSMPGGVAIQGPNPWCDVSNVQFAGGAKGNGDTVAPTDDTPAFQAATDFAHANPMGGWVFCGPYNFRLNGNLRTYANVSYVTFGGVLSGVGASSITFTFNMATTGGSVINGELWLPKPTGLDDTVAVQAIINTAAAISAIVRAWPGIYRFNTTVNTPNQSTGYISIRGAGKYATTFLALNAVDHVFNLQMPGEVTDCTFDGNAVTINALGLITTTTIAVSEMAARRVRCRNISTSAGLWLLVAWDTAQIYQLNKVYLEDVTLEGPTNTAGDGFTIAYVNHAFVNNMTCDGVGRPNFFFARQLDIDGLRIVNAPAGSTFSLIFDSGVDNLRASHLFIEPSVLTMAIRCPVAVFTDCEIFTSITINSASSLQPNHTSFHNCKVPGNVNNCLLISGGPIELLEIVGGEWGSQTALANTGIITDVCPTPTHHNIIRISDATLANPAVIFAFNAGIIVDELVVSNCTGWNPGRVLNDAIITTGSPTLQSPTGNFTARDVGRTVADPQFGRIPALTTITAFVDATHVTMSANATGNQNPDTVVMGGLSVTLNNPPTNGNVAPGVRSRYRGNSGFNPVGVEVVGVPATTVAVAAVPWDRTYYVTAAGGGAVTMTIQNGPGILIPAAQVVAVHVPAGKTVTPTYAVAPAWVVEGE